MIDIASATTTTETAAQQALRLPEIQAIILPFVCYDASLKAGHARELRVGRRGAALAPARPQGAHGRARAALPRV
jgi:hypothetical protein